MPRKFLWWTGAAVLIAVAALGFYLIPAIATVGGGYFAKMMCSGVFVAGLSEKTLLAAELSNPAGKLLRVVVDRDRSRVRAGMFGMAERVAVYRSGLGCTLASESDERTLAAQVHDAPEAPQAEAPWPPESTEMGSFDAAQLNRALEMAFSEPDPANPRRTRAVIVLHRGNVAAERYADGITASTRLQGWSMAKSVTNALVGILVGQGKLKVDAPAPVREWERDARGQITLGHMLRMSSGIAFNEDYVDLRADAPTMLFSSYSAGSYFAARPAALAPGKEWYYSSGTTNLISRIIREAVGGTLAEYWRFPRRALFERIGMNRAVFEPDASGTFVGSSFLYASARDWARFGLLYLRDGVWNGDRILPEGWVKYSTAPAPAAPLGMYGAHIWLNAGDRDDPSKRQWPSSPPDAFSFQGFEGQTVALVPSRQLVVVRLGVSQTRASWNFGSFLADVLRAFPGRPL